MRRYARISLAFAGCAAASAFLVAPMSAQEETPSTEPVQLVETYELMALLFDPAYQTLKANVLSEPTQRKQWKALYDSAYTLGEVTNLLLFREGEEYMATPEWDQLAVAARQAAADVAEAVKTKDYAKVKDLYIAMTESCNACHTKFEPDVAPVLDPLAPMEEKQ